MKNIKTIIQEKLKINKNVKATPLKNPLIIEIQNDFNKDYAYETYVNGGGANDYEYGFFIFDKENEFYSFTAFNKNDLENVEEELQIDSEQLLGLQVGTMASGKPNSRIIRLW